MNTPFIIALVGAVALGAAAAAAWLAVGHRVPAASVVARAAAVIGVLANGIYVGWVLADHGMVETFRQSEEAVLLLASLIAVVGIGTHVSPTLRGLDGFLFLLAAMVDLAALTMSVPATGTPTYHHWFISHGLSFAVSGACFMAGGMAAVAYLIVHRFLRRKALTLMGIPQPEKM